MAIQVVKANVLGFCFGVRRAVELAEKALLENPEKNVYSLGPLIHNQIALKNLCDKGMIIVNEDEIARIKNESVVIIRAHGCSPDILRELEKKSCLIVDATCPRVKNSQKIVEKKTNDDAFVILTGDSNHGEVKGIAGFAKDNFALIQNADEAEKFVLPADVKSVVLLSQTTFNVSEFENVSKILTKKIPSLEIINSICPATKERQEALFDLCDSVDGIIVIGGKNSANTIRLFKIAQQNCKNVIHVESACEIPHEFFALEKVGITAGASTPDEIIQEVYASLLNCQL